MSEIKAPSFGIPKLEAEQALSVSGMGFIMSGKSTQAFIDYIPHGHLNAITAAQLGEALSMSHRDVTTRIQAHRKQGAPICASCCEPYGYFVAEKPEELVHYLKSLDGRLREIRNTRDAMADALCKMTGQTRMEGF